MPLQLPQLHPVDRQVREQGQDGRGAGEEFHGDGIAHTWIAGPFEIGWYWWARCACGLLASAPDAEGIRLCPIARARRDYVAELAHERRVAADNERELAALTGSARKLGLLHSVPVSHKGQ